MKQTDDFHRYFSTPPVLDLLDEVKARAESVTWDATALNPCPFCGGKPTADRLTDGHFSVICSHDGCRNVQTKHWHEAVELWNKPRGW